MSGTLHFNLFEDKRVGPAGECSCVIRYADVVVWQELYCDAFWVRVFFSPTGEFMPRLRFALYPAPTEVRDYSHMFLARDNLLRKMQSPNMELFAENGQVIYPVFKSQRGHEREREHMAETHLMETVPVRASLSFRGGGEFIVEPVDFLSCQTLGFLDPSQTYGLWLHCRCAPVMVPVAGRVAFDLRCDIRADYFRLVFVLPEGAAPIEEECACSDTLFHPWHSCNPTHGQPGWISLVNTKGVGRKFVTNYYSTEECFSHGDGVLAYSPKFPLLSLSVREDGADVVLGKIYERQPLFVHLRPDHAMILGVVAAHYQFGDGSVPTDQAVARACEALHADAEEASVSVSTRQVRQSACDVHEAIAEAIGPMLAGPHREFVSYSRQGVGCEMLYRFMERFVQPSGVCTSVLAPRETMEGIVESILLQGGR